MAPALALGRLPSPRHPSARCLSWSPPPPIPPAPALGRLPSPWPPSAGRQSWSPPPPLPPAPALGHLPRRRQLWSPPPPTPPAPALSHLPRRRQSWDPLPPSPPAPALDRLPSPQPLSARRLSCVMKPLRWVPASCTARRFLSSFAPCMAPGEWGLVIHAAWCLWLMSVYSLLRPAVFITIGLPLDMMQCVGHPLGAVCLKQFLCYYQVVLSLLSCICQDLAVTTVGTKSGGGIRGINSYANNTAALRRCGHAG